MKVKNKTVTSIMFIIIVASNIVISSAALQRAPEKIPESDNLYYLEQPNGFKFIAQNMAGEYTGNLLNANFVQCLQTDSTNKYCLQAGQHLTFETYSDGEHYWTDENGNAPGVVNLPAPNSTPKVDSVTFLVTIIIVMLSFFKTKK